MSSLMKHEQHITHPMTEPQRKTKTMNMTMKKRRVKNCDVRAVSHSCYVFVYGSIILKFFVVALLTYTHQWLTAIRKIKKKKNSGHPTVHWP